jgi:hypothetical protein
MQIPDNGGVASQSYHALTHLGIGNGLSILREPCVVLGLLNLEATDLVHRQHGENGSASQWHGDREHTAPAPASRGSGPTAREGAVQRV